MGKLFKEGGEKRFLVGIIAVYAGVLLFVASVVLLVLYLAAKIIHGVFF